MPVLWSIFICFWVHPSANYLKIPDSFALSVLITYVIIKIDLQSQNIKKKPWGKREERKWEEKSDLRNRNGGDLWKKSSLWSEKWDWESGYKSQVSTLRRRTLTEQDKYKEPTVRHCSNQWTRNWDLEAKMWNDCVCWLFSRVQLFVTPWTVACQASLSMEFSRQEYWSGLPFPSPGIFLTQGSNLSLLHCSRFFTIWATRVDVEWLVQINSPKQQLYVLLKTWVWKAPRKMFFFFFCLEWVWHMTIFMTC